jgi:hypothetical protein
VIEWLQTGFGLVIGLIENLQIVTTSNYSAIANLHTLQFIIASTKSPQSAASSPVVAWCRIPTVPPAFVLTLLPAAYYPTTHSLLKLCYEQRSVGQFVFVSSTHVGPKTRFLLFRQLWVCWCREDGSIIYSCCWSSPAQSFSSPSPAGLMTAFYFLRFETPPTWRARSPYLSNCPLIKSRHGRTENTVPVLLYPIVAWAAIRAHRAGNTVPLFCLLVIAQ